MPESYPKLASKGNCLISGRLPGQQSESQDKVFLADLLKSDFWPRGWQGPGPQKVLKIRTKLTKLVANQGSESQALVMVV